MIIFSCKEVSRLASEGLDRGLSLPERLAMRTHLLVCAPCRLYRRQLLALARLLRLRGSVEPVSEDGPALSPEARERIQHALTNQPG